jgi:uncharacterized membrane protein YdbT with pleckstrin-like domain
MIYGQYQKLGPKTLSYMLYQKIAPCFLILLVIIGLKLVVNNSIAKINTINSPLTENILNSSLINTILNSSIIDAVFKTLILIWFLLVIILAIIVYLQYQNYKIMVTDDCLKITRGVLNKEEISLPYSKIESIDIKQSFDNQLFGVSRLIITPTNDLDEPISPNSKTNDSPDTDDEIIPIIDNDLALELQDILAQKANISKIKIQQ